MLRKTIHSFSAHHRNHTVDANDTAGCRRRGESPKALLPELARMVNFDVLREAISIKRPEEKKGLQAAPLKEAPASEPKSRNALAVASRNSSVKTPENNKSGYAAAIVSQAKAKKMTEPTRGAIKSKETDPETKLSETKPKTVLPRDTPAIGYRSPKSTRKTTNNAIYSEASCSRTTKTATSVSKTKKKSGIAANKVATAAIKETVAQRHTKRIHDYETVEEISESVTKPRTKNLVVQNSRLPVEGGPVEKNAPVSSREHRDGLKNKPIKNPTLKAPDLKSTVFAKEQAPFARVSALSDSVFPNAEATTQTFAASVDCGINFESDLAKVTDKIESLCASSSNSRKRTQGILLQGNSAANIAHELGSMMYKQDDFHHAGEDFDKGDSTPTRGKATPSTPGHLEFEFVERSKLKLSETLSSGLFEYTCMGKEKVCKGKSILKGIAKFKANPAKFIAMTYQKKMLHWPKANQDYTLILRAGTERLRPVVCNDGWMTVLLQEYQHLPPFERDELPEAFHDEYTRKMLLTHYGQPLQNKPILPGRGMGVGDTPLLKIIGDVDPNDIHQGKIGDCWLLSAISAIAEFDGAIKRLFRKTPNLVQRPLPEVNHYTITLWDLETWTEVDVVVDESLPASQTVDTKLLAAQPSSDGELWVCYLEKAFAIHCGGWDAITGGQCTLAWAMMTGCKEQYTIMKRRNGNYYCQARYNPNKKQWLPHHNSPHHPNNDTGMYEVEWPAIGGGGHGEISAEKLFKHMYAWDQANYIVSGGTKKTTTDIGLVDSHAYTIIESVEDACGTGINLLKVRNPWGEGEMEDGEFDDDGPGWDEYPQIRKLLKPVAADDGIFWMTDKEFFRYFDTIYVSASDMTEFLED